MARSRARFACLDCTVDTGKLHEYYMVHDHVWTTARLERQNGMLCVGCLERRIGRKLVPRDFSDCYINRGAQWNPRSDRLRSRMTAVECTR